MNKLVEKVITNIICTTFFIFILYIRVKLGTKQLDTFGFNR
jgi:hypothetical protein